MNTREYVKSLFMDETIMDARRRNVNLADLASSTEIVTVPITIELPAFIARALEVYKEDSGIRIEDLLEELILNKILNDEILVGKMIAAWMNAQSDS